MPQLAGKLHMIPLPRFEAADSPTASHGGTLIGIPRGARHPDDAWRLIQFLYFSQAGLADRAELGILPPLPGEWANPEFHQPDPFFGGQRTMELYAKLAPDVPAVIISPVNGLAEGTLKYVLSLAVQSMLEKGEVGLETRCQSWLDWAAVDLKQRIEHSRFDEKKEGSHLSS